MILRRRKLPGNVEKSISGETLVQNRDSSCQQVGGSVGLGGCGDDVGLMWWLAVCSHNEARSAMDGSPYSMLCNYPYATLGIQSVQRAISVILPKR